MLSCIHAGSRLRSRALFNASLMRNVPETATQVLNTVNAGDKLRSKILSKARKRGIVPIESFGYYNNNKRPVFSKQTVKRWIPSFAAAMVFTAAVIVSFVSQNTGARELTPIGMAKTRSVQPLVVQGFPQGIDSTSIVMTDAIPTYHTLFETTRDGQPAIITINGRFYRMLSAPSSLGTDLIGVKHGDILPLGGKLIGDAIGVFSNIAPDGEFVCSVGNYSTRTMVAVRVDDAMRVFQRVSYEGKSLSGDETFRDTLAVSGNVRALELSGVGALGDPDIVNALMDIMFANAVPASVPTIADNADLQSLIIHLNEGLSLQLLVSGDTIEACGAWDCPAFFREFEKYTEN
jgi:hypothetical protein